uniref:Uncharacterized protein n=1 Tax=Oryza rufipogon TaxID=4529 RepID=A0A0E0N001_ORYRU
MIIGFVELGAASGLRAWPSQTTAHGRGMGLDRACLCVAERSTQTHEEKSENTVGMRSHALHATRRTRCHQLLEENCEHMVGPWEAGSIALHTNQTGTSTGQ